MELFRYPVEMAWLAAGFAALIFFYFKARAAWQRAALRLIDMRQLTRLSGEDALARKQLRDRLYLAGLAFLLAAAGGPQWGMEMAPVADMNGNLVVAVDTSSSMGAKDIKPSRIENAKMMLNALADKFPDYRMGVIAFSGDAYVQCPLTTDSDAIKYFLSYLAPGILPVPGTNISSAITRAEEMLAKYSGPKILVLITDGEDLEGKVDEALASASENGMKIFTVGVGKTDGELIPMADQGGNVLNYKKDSSGKTVVTRLDEDTLVKIAQKTGAAYIRYGGEPETASEEIRAAVSRIAMSKTKGFGKASYRNHYRIPLFIALLLLLVELMFMEKGYALNAAIKKLSGLFRRTSAAALSALILLSLAPADSEAASARSLARSGNKAYDRKDFPKAYDHYSKALIKDAGNDKILFNRGAAFYRMEDYEKAVTDFEEASKGPGIKSDAAYNAGNAYFKSSNLSKAIEKYRESILADPKNKNAKHNLQIALAQQKQNQCENPQQKKQKDQEKKQDEKKDRRDQDKKEQSDQKKREEQKKKEAARKQADKLLEMMKEKEKSSGNQEMMNARYNNKPPKTDNTSGKDW